MPTINIILFHTATVVSISYSYFMPRPILLAYIHKALIQPK